ncbi:unnamed protein product [Euphydryas editha]|uniref:Uncharacterized protein n=1 Tax=Euphydryas editha TaxID=104508 RepID=A0AAU9USF0_EUPED|nr:unnamed protein product [Euphydryas editha]
MGAKFTKKNSFAENFEQLIKESNLGHILEQEHHRIVEKSVPYSCYESQRILKRLRVRVVGRAQIHSKTQEWGFKVRL